eukprot:249488-Rhodomonas_salina.1
MTETFAGGCGCPCQVWSKERSACFKGFTGKIVSCRPRWANETLLSLKLRVASLSTIQGVQRMMS